ncbi:MAG: hypothetical protein K2K56_15085 [Lachnospiraceae bacterium]|nr:hypothetical protein [Lachnospiraceae bacterium]
MGFFDKFKGNAKEPKLNEQIIAYKKMIELLDVDADTAAKLNSCINDPHSYYEENAETYNERGVASNTDDDTIIWLGIVDILIEQGKMFEFDYSVELEDFIYGIQEINNNNLVFDEDRLDEDSDITEWLKILSDEWMISGYIIAGMDIDSDSYCVFITIRNAFDKLVVEAEKTGHKIVLAQDM